MKNSEKMLTHKQVKQIFKMHSSEVNGIIDEIRYSFNFIAKNKAVSKTALLKRVNNILMINNTNEIKKVYTELVKAGKIKENKKRLKIHYTDNTWAKTIYVKE